MSDSGHTIGDSGRSLGEINPFKAGQALGPVGKAPSMPITQAALASLVGGPGRSNAAQGQIIHPTMVSSQDRRADLVWGGSKDGKGFNAWTAAYWMAKTHGKKTLYLTAEPGSIIKSIHNFKDAGLLDIFSVVNQPHLLSILSSVLEGGKWPVYRKMNDGSIIRDFKSREANCDPNQYGLLIVDSLTSLGDEFIKWLADPDNKATLPMTPSREKFWIEDSEDGGQVVKIGGSGMTHVGFATRILQQMVVGSANLPYDKILWIAREQRASRGEKKDKDGNILVAGEPMYGPDLPGQAATPRVTGWFGAAYHVDKVPVGGQVDDRADVGTGGTMLGNMKEKLTTIPNWEYRIYLRPHPDPRTGIMYDAGNRLEAHLNANDKIVPPYIVCTEQKVGKEFVHTGLNTIMELERVHGVNSADDLKETFSDILAKFGPPAV